MDPADIASLFFADEEDTSAPAKATALAQALRGQQRNATLLQLTGDKVLGGVGGGMMANAQQGLEAIPKAANMRLQRATEAAKAKTEADWRHTQEQHFTEQDRLERVRLAQDAYSVSPANPYGPALKLNKKSGAVEPIEGVAGPGGGLTGNQELKEWKAFADGISTNRSGLAKDAQERLNASERLKALVVNPDGSLKNLNPSTMAEVAATSAGIITGGSPAMHTIETMTPKTVGSDWAKIKEWLSGNPQGADQLGFVQLMLNQANREEHIIGGQLRRAQLQGVPNYAHLGKKDKARYESILKGAGIDPASIDERGLEVQAQAAHGGAPSAPTRTPEERAKRRAELEAIVRQEKAGAPGAAK